MRNPIIGFDPARPASTGMVIYHGDHSMVMTPLDTRAKAQDFREKFLEAVAGKLAVPYSAFIIDQQTVYDIRMDGVRALIRRAASKKAHGFRGWSRKLKKARRLQLEICRHQTSNAWFDMQWRDAVSFFRLHRYPMHPLPTIDPVSLIGEVNVGDWKRKGWR